MNFEFEFHRAETDDDHEFFCSAWIETFLQVSNNYKLSPEMLLKIADDRKKIVLSNKGKIEILFHNKEYVGVIAYYFFNYGPSIICRVELIYLTESYRGRGLFKHLINRVLNASSRMRVTCIEAYVECSNQVSSSCFKKTGFFPLGIIYHKSL